MSNLEIKTVQQADPAAILALYRQNGWWEPGENPRHLEQVSGIVRNTFRFVIALDGERIIGMGRAISDGVSDAYIQDVTVHDDYRRRGIGRAIVLKLIEELKAGGVGWIGLISEPGYESFYQSMGFEIMPNYTPFLLKQD